MPFAYANSKFVLFASRSENCPNILLEAMACGCAILCSNKNPMPEFAEDSVLYFDPEDHIDLAKAIQRFLTERELVESCSLKAKAIGKKLTPRFAPPYAGSDLLSVAWKTK